MLRQIDLSERLRFSDTVSFEYGGLSGQNWRAGLKQVESSTAPMRRRTSVDIRRRNSCNENQSNILIGGRLGISTTFLTLAIQREGEILHIEVVLRDVIIHPSAVNGQIFGNFVFSWNPLFGGVVILESRF